MLFRVNSLSKMYQSCRMTICFWLDQPEFDTDKDEFSKKATIKPFILQLKQISSQIGDKFDLKQFQEIATKVVEELNGTDGLDGSLYFYEVLKSQISLLTCVHELDVHAEEMMNNARWLVAEYLRQGFDEKELSGLNSVFRRIMKFGELKTSIKPHRVEFPMPSELREKRNSNKFKPALKKYLENNAFVAQFEGMLNALQETQNGEIYFRIDGIRKQVKGDFEFSYAGVTLTTVDKIPFTSLGFNDHILKIFEDYFGAANTIVAKVPMQFKSKKQATSTAKVLVNRALDALRYVLDDSGGKISTNHVIIAWADGGANYNMNGDQNLDVYKFDLDMLQDFKNTIPYPENITAEVRIYLDRCSRIFFKGLSSENEDDMISHFWQYWETAFGFYSPADKKDLNKAEYIIKNTSLILANHSCLTLKTRLGLLIHSYAINNNGNEDIGIPTSYYGSSFDYKNPEKTVQEVKMLTNYPFLKRLIERFEAFDSIADDLWWEKFYSGFLWQLYEQRNFILHNGIYCPATLERLKFFFRSIVVNWQSKLFEELEKVPNSTIQEAIERLILNSKIP
jgi:hypothetical protein